MIWIQTPQERKKTAPTTPICKYDKLIYGKDQTEKVVNISVDDTNVHIFTQDIDGKVTSTVKMMKYYTLAPKNIDNMGQKLEGNQFYKWGFGFPTFREYINFKSKHYQLTWNPIDLTEMFMIRNGYTYYKGMSINEMSILSVDIETTGLNPKDDNAQVILIANTFRDSKGQIQKKLFDIQEYEENEGKMIEEWTQWTKRMDPSIIIGHNIFAFDLPYLNTRSLIQNNCVLNIGRLDFDIQFRDRPSQFRKDGSQSYEYHDIKIFGREVIDTMFLSIKYDNARNFPSYSLKRIMQYLQLEKQNRIVWDFNANPTNKWRDWDQNVWGQFREYCIDDGDDALTIFDIMVPSYFYFTQSIPMSFQAIINRATGSQLNSFMCRAYLQDNHSVAKSSDAEKFEGAISMGNPGIYKNVRKVDVASLYPSIMRQYKIYDEKKDPKQYFLKAVEYFTKERLKNKSLSKSTGKQYFNDLEQSQKIAINSMYGFLGASGLNYNSPKNAANVTRFGREILLKGVEWATGHTLTQEIKKIIKKDTPEEKIQYHWVNGKKIGEGRGYTLVNVDTDSFSVTNGIAPTPEEYTEEISELNSLYPELIRWEDDGIFDKVIVVKAKNYILQSGDKIKYKGSSITDQKKEPALTEYLHQLIGILLNSDISDNSRDEKFVECYRSYIKEAMNITDINRWCTKKTITKSIFESSRTNETKVLDAIQRSNLHVQEGDKIWVYNAIDGYNTEFTKTGKEKHTPNKIIKLAEDFDPNNTEEIDFMHYIKRIYATTMILENILDKNLFINYTLKSNIEKLKEVQ